MSTFDEVAIVDMAIERALKRLPEQVVRRKSALKDWISAKLIIPKDCFGVLNRIVV